MYTQKMKSLSKWSLFKESLPGSQKPIWTKPVNVAKQNRLLKNIKVVAILYIIALPLAFLNDVLFSPANLTGVFAHKQIFELLISGGVYVLGILIVALIFVLIAEIVTLIVLLLVMIYALFVRAVNMSRSLNVLDVTTNSIELTSELSRNKLVLDSSWVALIAESDSFYMLTYVMAGQTMTLPLLKSAETKSVVDSLVAQNSAK